MMTITDPPRTSTVNSITMADATVAPLDVVEFDLYRDVHKGLRAELFRLTADLGTADTDDDELVVEVSERVDAMIDLLDDHAHHEEHFLGPLIARHTPHLSDRILHEHRLVEGTMAGLGRLTVAARTADDSHRRRAVHRLYLAMAGFTSEYVAHLATEELEVMPSLAAGYGLEELLEVNGALVASIPPEQMDTYLRLMIPATNPLDRAELLGGMSAEMPEEAFSGVLAIADDVLDPVARRRLDRDLGAV